MKQNLKENKEEKMKAELEKGKKELEETEAAIATLEEDISNDASGD